MSSHQLSQPQSRFIVSNSEVAAKWNSCAKTYQSVDSCMQTGYYTLSNMLQLSSASNILEVACGTGRLLPYMLQLKPQNCSYLATDISEEMIITAHDYLQKYIHKLGVTCQFNQWLKKQNLKFLTHNGENSFEVDFKFDRIICNLGIHITENPFKMLENFYNHAEKGCLMGLSVLGGIDNSPMFKAPQLLRESLGIPQPRMRSFSHLYNELGKMAEKIGWQVVLQWDQTFAYSFIEADEELRDYLIKVVGTPPQIFEGVLAILKADLDQKKTLTFPAQFLICKKI